MTLKYPLGHDVHAAAPMPEDVPAAHTVQVDAPTSDMNPPGQKTQGNEPRAIEYMPAGHRRGVDVATPQ